MYTNKVALALAPLFLLARADMQLDSEDVPSACTSICAPIVELTRLCEVDLAGDNNDRTEDQLEAQCVCTNDSFSVSSIASTCAACIYANQNSSSDDDSTQDINDILYTCGWSRGSWSTASATQASGITVQATAPTASSQLTTTIVPGATNTNSAASTGTKASSASGSQSATSTNNVITSTSTTTSSSDDDNSDDDNAASALAPMGIAGAAVAFAALLLV